MNYEVHVKQVGPSSIVTERKHTSFGKLGEEMHSTLANIARAVQPSESAQGVPFAIYYNEPFRHDDVEVEMGVPLRREARVDETGRVHRRELPGGSVAYTEHVGPYASIGSAYRALFDWIERHGHRRLGAPRELYIVGPTQTKDPEAYRTSIEIPID